jgi:uncharacterized protein involved in exopolysaccharide biosynthesis
MIELMDILLKWKKHILLFSAFCIVVSIIITFPFIMPPYFKSQMIFYPSNPQSIDRANLFNQKEGGGVSQFGGKDDVNRFMSIATSNELISYITQKYDLGKHYKIKAKTPELFAYYTKREFVSNFKVLRNDEGAIEVTILDRDPKLASTMIEEVVKTSNDIYRAMIRENKTLVLQQLDNLIDHKLKEIDTSNGYKKENLLENLADITSLRDQYAVSTSQDFKSIYIIENPAPAVKKEKPVRWIIILSTAILSFAFATLLAIIIELYKNADQYRTKVS